MLPSIQARPLSRENRIISVSIEKQLKRLKLNPFHIGILHYPASMQSEYSFKAAHFHNPETSPTIPHKSLPHRVYTKVFFFFQVQSKSNEQYDRWQRNRYSILGFSSTSFRSPMYN